MAGTGKAIEIEEHTVQLLPAACEESLAGETGIQHVFVIGSKGIPARYGGFETFVENLTLHRHSDRIRYHVARMAEDDLRFEYNGAVCFDIKVPYIGPARAVVCDLAALERSIRYCQKHPEVRKPVFYILACADPRPRRRALRQSRRARVEAGEMERSGAQILEVLRGTDGQKRGPSGL